MPFQAKVCPASLTSVEPDLSRPRSGVVESQHREEQLAGAYGLAAMKGQSAIAN